ncbi:hypothetical protein [Coralloluteibacterium thermophilus]|uniref:Uncharacterized protein n=1 Tax=Coralloluteibacterium thermophilum TaxID=2707049 RepID=A0ABV9NH83_9GAMM
MGSDASKEQRRAREEAERAEADRRAAIAAATNQVNNIFGSPQREADLQDYLGAVRETYRTDLDRQKADADRESRFAMARSGLIGGSADIDLNRRVADNYTRGVLNAEQAAQRQVANLRSQDQQAKLNLLQMVQSGMDATTAARNASESLRVNLAGARADQNMGAVDNAFGQLSGVWQDSKNRANERRKDSLFGQTYFTPGQWGALTPAPGFKGFGG